VQLPHGINIFANFSQSWPVITNSVGPTFLES
jgi:hypothetical protein